MTFRLSARSSGCLILEFENSIAAVPGDSRHSLAPFDADQRAGGHGNTGLLRTYREQKYLFGVLRILDENLQRTIGTFYRDHISLIVGERGNAHVTGS